MMRRAAGLFAALMLASACGGPTTSSGQGHVQRHVFVIVMENHSFDEAMTGPFTAALAAEYGVAQNYHAVAHPSVPNYLALTSGSTWGITDDSYRALPQQDIGTQLTSVGTYWRAYMEGLTSAGCLKSPLPYDPGHNPFAFYGGQCPPNVVPLTSLSADLASSTPRFIWITPDRCHDTHDCPVSTGDAWLHQEVSLIMASSAWKSNGVLFITWDEDDNGPDNHVLTLVVTPAARHRTSTQPYTHYSLLATVEDVLAVARLGSSAKAAPMNDLLP
jgi:phospholipase C